MNMENLNNRVKLLQGDNMESFKKLPDNSIDSVVTDGPYGLSFMGKKWDYDVPSVEFWKEVYRVLKPGGHILSFGGTRTYHRMVVNIEDAGFEIRDQIMWLYGSGFPKSRNIGKDIEKINVGGLGNLKQIGTKKGTVATNHHELATKDKPKGFSYKTASHTISHSEVATARTQTTGDIPVYEINNEYDGWGTALKPANEPICLARKPLSEKSVAENVLKWKTGGINVDGCRVGFNGDKPKECELVDFRGNGDQMNLNASGKERKTIEDRNYIPNEEGRFPANIILDEIAGEILDSQSGVSLSKKSKRGGAIDNNEGRYNWNKGDNKIVDKYECGFDDKGGASRFFYQAKVSKKERNMGLEHFEDKVIEGRDAGQDERNVAYKKRPTPTKNTHPTVKPVSLMSYLCRLITPPNGIVLDPFMGSGSTGIAAQLEGFRFVGMELDKDYFKIAESRIENYEKYREFLK